MQSAKRQMMHSMDTSHKKPALGKPSTKQTGDASENRALQHLSGAGLKLLERNYRTPGRGGGEVDLIMLASDGTVVFVEVRHRSASAFGGAAASVTAVKQRRIIFAARHYLLRFRDMPACRFDVVTTGPEGVQWLQAAFDAS